MNGFSTYSDGKAIYKIWRPGHKMRILLDINWILRLRFAILQGAGHTLKGSNAQESQICGAKPCVPLIWLRVRIPGLELTGLGTAGYDFV